MVDEWLGNVPLERAQCVFNYGLQGDRLDTYIERHPRITDLPNLNMYQFGNKYECVMAVRQAVMPAPMSWKYRQRADIDVDRLIVKPYYSLGGRGVHRVNGPEYMTEEERRTHYLQEEITNRRYELRCLAASWVDPQNWLFLKRVHDNGEAELAWNHHNGGRFITVNDPSDALFGRVREDVKKMLPLLGYQFGAVDFIIQNNPGGRLKHFFIEWNLAPGWSMPSTQEWYNNCFLTLKTEPLENIECYEHGMLLEDIKEQGDNTGPYQRRINQLLEDINVPDDERPDDPDIDDDAWDMPDWAEVEARFENGANPVPDQEIVYSLMGGVLVDTPANRYALTDNDMANKYVSIGCENGHNLLLRIGTYSCYCPACGSHMRIQM
jgi:hypothetical protein